MEQTNVVGKFGLLSETIHSSGTHGVPGRDYLRGGGLSTGGGETCGVPRRGLYTGRGDYLRRRGELSTGGGTIYRGGDYLPGGRGERVERQGGDYARGGEGGDYPCNLTV